MNLVKLKKLTDRDQERFRSDFKYLVEYPGHCGEPGKAEDTNYMKLYWA